MRSTMLLSKIIENNDYPIIVKYNITTDDFSTQEQKNAFNFVLDYAKQNNFCMPDFRTVAIETGFECINNINDSYKYLINEIRDRNTKIKLVELLQNDAQEKFSNKNSKDFSNWLIDEINKITSNNNVIEDKVGIDIVKDINLYKAEYENRKSGKSNKCWSSSFKKINDNIGGYHATNTYVWYARSGKGKSTITATEAVNAFLQGANVLIWSLEMNKYDYMSRLYSAISSIEKRCKYTHNNNKIDAGYNTNSLINATLDEDFEKDFYNFLDNLKYKTKGSLIIKALDDEDFERRDCKALESDIIKTNADVVVIDPIYLMELNRNTSKVAGGDVASTSRELRRIAGKHGIVLHIITQAEEKETTLTENDEPILKVPQRSDMKKSKAILEDASVVFALDTLDSNGIIKINKGRSGGENTTINILYLPNYGIIKQFDIDDVAEKFSVVY